MAINTCTLCGNLTRDPEHKRVGEFEVIEFSIAVNERRKKGDSWVDDPQFVDCELWGPRAHTLGQFLKKGMKVTLTGALRYHAWEKDGQKRSRITVNVKDVELPARVDAARQPQQTQAPQGYYPTPF